MNTTQRLIKAVMARHGLTTPAAFARLMNWSDARVSNYTRGMTQADPDATEQLAKLAGENANAALVAIEAERAKSPALRRALSAAAAQLAA